MRNFIVISIYLFSQIFSSSSINAQSSTMIKFDHDEKKEEIKVMINGEHFTTYLYHSDLEKPVLFPIYSSDGHLMTRGYPFIPIAGERVDHPHHLGLWLNYGDVNGLDFWNNSSAIAPEIKGQYGEIRHRSVAETDDGGRQATLKVTCQWMTAQKEALLDEESAYTFSVVDGVRIVDRTTKLTANTLVKFTDNKEGMIGIRVARMLEFPSEKPLNLTDKRGNPKSKKELNNEGVKGNYLSSAGMTGGDVWGTRARWMKLYAPLTGEDEAAFVIIDHPDNVGYPTYWHARTYGLFAANPLGQKIFDKEKELNFSLQKGEEVTFRYRILVSDGKALSPIDIAKFEAGFLGSN